MTWVTSKPEFSTDYAILRFVGVKAMSGYLARLYHMSLLSRTRQKREVRTRDGKVCFKGYKYVYSVSKQGRQYAAFLKSSPAAVKGQPIYRPDNVGTAIEFQRFENSLPEELRPFAQEMHRAFSGKNYVPIGRYNRFPREKLNNVLVLLLWHYATELKNEKEHSQFLQAQNELLIAKLREKNNPL